jgi:LysR family carnitine catabolism transcriptional activator
MSQAVTLKQLRAFVAVAKTASFAEAGSLVNLSQPALSITIKNLEQAVGGKLLVRSTRTLALSPEGQSFLPVARRMIADWDGAFLDLHNMFALKRGKLNMACMPSFAANQLASTLQTFRQAHENINVTVHDVVAEEVVSMVREGKVECGICFDPGNSEDLNFTPLFNDEFVVALPAGHELAHKKKLAAKHIQNEPYISLQAPSSMSALIAQKIESYNSENTTKQSLQTLSPSLEAHQLASIGSMVANGLGVSIVPSLCAPLFKQQGAVCIALHQPKISQQVGLLTRRRYALSAAAKSFADCLFDLYGVQAEHGL